MAQIEEFPKFQYSEFIKTSNQDGQFVVRAETIEEFKLALREMRIAILEGKKAGAQIQPNQQPVTEENPYGKCPKCGAWMVKNPKNGNIFCKDKCWLG